MSSYSGVGEVARDVASLGAHIALDDAEAVIIDVIEIAEKSGAVDAVADVVETVATEVIEAVVETAKTTDEIDPTLGY